MRTSYTAPHRKHSRTSRGQEEWTSSPGPCDDDRDHGFFCTRMCITRLVCRYIYIIYGQISYTRIYTVEYYRDQRACACVLYAHERFLTDIIYYILSRSSPARLTRFAYYTLYSSAAGRAATAPRCPLAAPRSADRVCIIYKLIYILIFCMHRENFVFGRELSRV
jgi:hypothetical protein